MKRSYSSKLVLSFIGLLLTSFYLFMSPQKEGNYVNIYDWYGMISNDILLQFEQETGVRVRYDMYDNNEVLEAKLLASNSGYDVVFPSASPYAARQIQAGVYQKLNKTLLPNLKNLEPIILKHMLAIDSSRDFVIPYYWGTLGIAFDVDVIKTLLPDVDVTSYHLLLDPKNLERLSENGVCFLEEAIDIFPVVLRYLGKNPDVQSSEDLDLATQHLLKLRPFIRRFTSSRFINDLVTGEVCIAQAWSGEAQQAIREAKQTGRTLQYVIPKEGTTLWIDCMAIPEGAPHPKNAHLFINFLLRPDISSRLTNHTYIPTVVTAAKKMVSPEIRDDTTIYPDQEMMAKLRLDKPQLDPKSLAFDRLRTRAWTRVRLAH